MLSEQIPDFTPSENRADEASPADVWSTALAALSGKVSEQNFDLWFRPIRCAACTDHTLLLIAPNRFLKEWFETHYLAIVLDEIRRISGTSRSVSWQLQEAPADEPAARPDGARDVPAEVPARPKSGRARGPIPGASTAPARGSASVADKAAQGAGALKDGPDLLTKYTFDSFVIGPSNQLAAAASRAVADNPGGKYNPLFIYGGVGLGKTHLLHAIGHHIHAQHPSWRILYLKTETFMNEYINQVRTGRIEEFRAKYRDSTDVLLMDDIQYLGGKERTQDEFFHTFNALFESHRQIVVTADKYPHEIPDLEERIRSRFQWGLIADIQAPELETRIAILQKKAEYDKIDLPSEVAHYLAAHIKSNVRELEGLLIRVAAFASLQQSPITVEFVQETLKNFLTTSTAHLTVEAVLREVANYFNVKIADLKGTSRHASVTRPRQVAMYLSRKLCKASFPEIGQKFGGKDHTTVMSACRRVEGLLVEDPKVRSMVQEIERHLSA
jgi:chromosomal replication initiator protein